MRCVGFLVLFVIVAADKFEKSDKFDKFDKPDKPDICDLNSLELYEKLDCVKKTFIPFCKKFSEVCGEY